MFESWKEKRAEKKAKDKAIRESQYWKNNALLQSCLQSMRGSCTLAPVELHEATVAAVNIAFMENTWVSASQIPADFLSGNVFLIWSDEKLPVLKAPWDIARENLQNICAVDDRSFLVSEELDRIVQCFGGQYHLYCV